MIPAAVCNLLMRAAGASDVCGIQALDGREVPNRHRDLQQQAAIVQALMNEGLLMAQAGVR